MRLLLDTSAYSELHRDHETVIERLRRSSEVAVSPVLLGELRSRFRAGARQAQNEQVLQRFLAKPSVRLLTIDSQTSEHYAALHADLRSRGVPVPTNDLWLAASAAQHGLRILTLDAHFLRFPTLLVEYLGPAPAP